MKHLKKHHSILFTLLTPIFSITFLILLFAALTVSAIYIQQTEAASIRSNQEILKQTDATLQLVHSHIYQISANIIQKPYLGDLLIEPINNVLDGYNIRHQIGNLFKTNPYAMINYEITIAGVNGFAVSSGNGGPTLEAEEMLNLPVFQKSLNNNRIVYDSLPQGISYSTSGSAVIIGCRPLLKSDGTLCGGIFITIPEASLRQFYQSIISPNSDILLLSSDGTVLSSNIQEDVGTKNSKLLENAKENRKKNLEYTKNNDSDIIVSRYISYYDSYIISRITTSTIYQSFLPGIKTIAVILLALILLFFSIMWIMKRNLLPLRKLADHMAGAKDIPMPTHDIGGASEIEMITTSYNKMTNTIRHYLKELNEANEKQRKDELDLLQMQINPHFLYNTLNSVKHLIEMQNNGNACQIIDSLISLLRSTLGKTNTMVTVADEVKNVKNYISIIEPRYGGLVKAEIFVESECLSCEIPNLLLQPLVENAFFHAFQETKTGLIRIFISKIGSEISCEIIDNGDGMNSIQITKTLKTPKSDQQSATRIGLSNVKERLNLLYPDKNTFQITSELGYGTNITLSFPALNYEKRKT